MTTQLKPFTVSLYNNSKDIIGRILVQATCPVHAGQVAVTQTVDISYPQSRAEQWAVTGVKALS